VQRLIAVIGLQAYALCFAFAQLQGRVHTDEAKYLLNVPYPHPPLVRWILSLFDGWAWQEVSVRILFATIVIQAAWMAWAIGRTRIEKTVLAAVWLLSWGVLSQAGTVMMSPLTAVQGLFFAWLYLRKEDDTRHAGLVALAWMASLFTAYQIALFFPLVAAVFRRMRLPAWQRVVLFGAPVLLLCLYTLGNPLALASMVGHAGKGSADPSQQIGAFLDLFRLSGNDAVALLAVVGLALRPSKPVIASFFLVCLYVFLGSVPYYAVLFAPFFIAGLPAVFRFSKQAPFAVGIVAVACAGLTLSSTPLVSPPTPARDVMAAIADKGREGTVLIQGSFGHEWQYESPFPILQYGEWLLPDAQAVVCTRDTCDVRGLAGFELLMDEPAEVWLKR